MAAAGGVICLVLWAAAGLAQLDDDVGQQAP